MTEPNRSSFAGFFYQSSASEAYFSPVNVHGHFLTSTYFTAYLPNHHHAVPYMMTANQYNDVNTPEETSDSVHLRCVGVPSSLRMYQLQHKGENMTAIPAGQCSNLAPTSQLCLPTLKTSSNVAENVMREETDLGYSSWSDNMPLDSFTGNGEFEVSSGSDDVFDDFSDIIDEMTSNRVDSSDVPTKEMSEVTANVTAMHFNSHFKNTNSITNQHVSILQSHRDAATEQFLQRVQERQQSTKRPQQCPICSKQFTNKTNLQVHLRMHTDFRPHQCPYCDKSFTQKSSLRTHMRIHTGEKPFVCSHCSRAFSDCSTYRKHQRIHSGEKPYTCDICQKAFSQSGNMIRHRQTHIKKQ